MHSEAVKKEEVEVEVSFGEFTLIVVVVVVVGPRRVVWSSSLLTKTHHTQQPSEARKLREKSFASLLFGRDIGFTLPTAKNKTSSQQSALEGSSLELPRGSTPV